MDQDWEHVRAVDLLVSLQSFLPKVTLKSESMGGPVIPAKIKSSVGMGDNGTICLPHIMGGWARKAWRLKAGDYVI